MIRRIVCKGVMTLLLVGFIVPSPAQGWIFFNWPVALDADLPEQREPLPEGLKGIWMGETDWGNRIQFSFSSNESGLQHSLSVTHFEGTSGEISKTFHCPLSIFGLQAGPLSKTFFVCVDFSNYEEVVLWGERQWFSLEFNGDRLSLNHGSVGVWTVDSLTGRECSFKRVRNWPKPDRIEIDGSFQGVEAFLRENMDVVFAAERKQEFSRWVGDVKEISEAR